MQTHHSQPLPPHAQGLPEFAEKRTEITRQLALIGNQRDEITRQLAMVADQQRMIQHQRTTFSLGHIIQEPESDEQTTTLDHLKSALEDQHLWLEQLQGRLDLQGSMLQDLRQEFEQEQTQRCFR